MCVASTVALGIWRPKLKVKHKSGNPSTVTVGYSNIQNMSHCLSS